MPRHFPIMAAALMALIILMPVDGFAGDGFARSEGHDQYFARRDSIALGLGNAVHSNRVIHTIDPWPSYSKNDKLKFDGQRMSLGITRYKANESIEPEGLQTQDISGDNGSGGR